MRLYNPAIGKFLSVDPIAKEYPFLTPYQFASNKPIQGIDLDGLEFVDANGTSLGALSPQAISARQDANQYTYSIGFSRTYYPKLQTASGNTVRLMSDRYTNFNFRMGNNRSPFVNVLIRHFFLNVSDNNQTISHEAVQYDADANSDYDGPHANLDLSGGAAWSTSLNSGIVRKGKTGPDTERDHWTWSLDGTTDFYSAIPSDLKNGFAIQYGDIMSATYNGITGVGTVADGSGQKIGELSGFALLSFGVNPNHGMGGITTTDVRYMIFKNTSLGEHNYPNIQNDPQTQQYVRELSTAINTSINQNPKAGN